MTHYAWHPANSIDGNCEGNEDTKPPDENVDIRLCAAHLYLIVGTASFVCLAAALAVDHYTHLHANVGVYAILAVLSIGGDCGWIAHSTEARNRRHLGRQQRDLSRQQREIAQQQRELFNQLAQLTAAMESLAERLTPARPHSAPTCRPAVGRMYMSQAHHDRSVGIQAASVDDRTDPAGAALQRAREEGRKEGREEGAEEGFQIGYRAQLAERGIPSLPPPQRRRLTGDS
ncbi:hypothetical protein AB0L34_27655 [Micromonospora sp. NPDC052213]|uniref:hypothetical protein n=1 Tax=Micromonospora sp. NPDC052213 TaxID=3155812 RepID=UPI00342A4F07